MTPHDELPEPEREAWDVDALWAGVRARTVDAPLWPWRVPRWAYAYAATLVVCAAGATLFVRSHNRAVALAGAAAQGDYRTSRGQYATVRLADSSEVTLAPESRLTISARFGAGAREIALEGEAIFSVRHDAARPFRVRTQSAVVEDIGTRFDLRAYPGDASTMVAVVQGAVSLAADSAPHGANGVVLHGGEVGTLDRHGHITAERSSSASNYLGWADGRLSFVDRPLPEVLRTIARWYDLDVRVTDAGLARRLVTADFVRQSPAEMLAALAITMNATVERNGRIVTLSPR